MQTYFLVFLGVGVLDSMLFVVGGHDGPLVRKSVEVFNPETNSWAIIADMHLCRRNAGESSPSMSSLVLILWQIQCGQIYSAVL